LSIHKEKHRIKEKETSGLLKAKADFGNQTRDQNSKLGIKLGAGVIRRLRTATKQILGKKRMKLMINQMVAGRKRLRRQDSHQSLQTHGASKFQIQKETPKLNQQMMMAGLRMTKTKTKRIISTTTKTDGLNKIQTSVKRQKIETTIDNIINQVQFMRETKVFTNKKEKTKISRSEPQKRQVMILAKANWTLGWIKMT
jgi:hypothetical protein